MGAFKFCISKLVSKLRMRPATLKCLGEEMTQRAGEPATLRGVGPGNSHSNALAAHYTVHINYLIRFDLMKTRNKTVK